MSKDNLTCFWQARSCRHHHCVNKRDCDHNGLDCTDIARSYQPSPHSPSNRERLERGQGSTKSWDQGHNSHQRQSLINTQHSANEVQSQLKQSHAHSRARGLTGASQLIGDQVLLGGSKSWSPTYDPMGMLCLRNRRLDSSGLGS